MENAGLFTVLPVLMCVMSLVAFVCYGIDKRKAKKGAWRISEATLIGLAVFFGGIGALCGMKCFHHKTKHLKFEITVPLFALLQAALLVYVYFHF